MFARYRRIFFPGYLPQDEVQYVCEGYNSLYNMNISEARVKQALLNALSMDATNGFVNLDLFCKFLNDAVEA